MAKNQKPAKRKPKSACSRQSLLFSKPSERFFTMAWEVNEANRLIDLHHLLAGTYFDENGEPNESIDSPMHVYCNAYKGDFPIASKAGLIPDENCYHVRSRVHAVNSKTGEHLFCDYQMLCNTPLTIVEFMFGESAENNSLYVEESGLKTRWKGYYPALEEYLDSFSDDFDLKTNHCELTCKAAFYSFQHEKVFKSLKLIHSTPAKMVNGRKIA